MTTKTKRILTVSILVLLSLLCVYALVSKEPVVHAAPQYTITCTGNNGSWFNIYDESMKEGYTGPSGASLVVNVGDTIKITVTPPNGTIFSEWTVDGAKYSTLNPVTFIANPINGETWTAVFSNQLSTPLSSNTILITSVVALVVLFSLFFVLKQKILRRQ